jgi:hypothetical protein
MLKRIFFIIVLLLFLVGGEIYGQQNNGENIPLIYSDSLSWMYGKRVQSFSMNDKKITGALFSNYGLAPGINFLRPSCFSPVTPDFYSRNLSFFCRTEMRFEKATSIPLRFRLGSLQYTDYLEKKPNAVLR